MRVIWLTVAVLSGILFGIYEYRAIDSLRNRNSELENKIKGIVNSSDQMLMLGSGFQTQGMRCEAMPSDDGLTYNLACGQFTLSKFPYLVQTSKHQAVYMSLTVYDIDENGIATPRAGK